MKNINYTRASQIMILVKSYSLGILFSFSGIHFLVWEKNSGMYIPNSWDFEFHSSTANMNILTLSNGIVNEQVEV